MRHYSLFILISILTLKVMATEIKTQVTINATPDKVWEILTNFKG